MKKLLSLALVLTMLFTIISVPSVSAATYKETIIAAANFTGLTVTKKMIRPTISMGLRLKAQMPMLVQTQVKPVRD